MPVVRDTLSLTWTMISVTVVVSLIWFLITTRKDRAYQAGQLALAFILMFSGSLESQLYSLLVMRNAAGGDVTSLTPFFPLAMLAVAQILAGGAWSAWLFRPRRVQLVLFWTIVLGTGLVLATLRLMFMR